MRARRPTTAFVLATTAALLLAAAPATGDPRWWWHDLRVTDNATDSITPHLFTPGYGGGGVGLGSVFITWAEVDPVGGDLEIWVTATFDDGCTFCPPTRLTDNAVDDTNPRIALVNLPEGVWSFAVAFESQDQVVIAWDSLVVSYQAPPEQLCNELSELGPAIVGNDQYVRFGVPGARADRPDIEPAWSPMFAHFHAVWHDTRGGRHDIYHARDLTGRGGAAWHATPEKNLTQENVELQEDHAPVLAPDILTDPDPVTGMATASYSGLTVSYLSVGPTDEVEIRTVRSSDSGTTFSPTGLRQDSPPAAISDPSGPGRPITEPAIDSAWQSWSFTDPVWVATTWLGPTSELAADTRQLVTPATGLPDWQAPDLEASVTCQPIDVDLSITLAGFGTGPAPAWIAWEDDRFGMATEIGHRAGLLDDTANPSSDFQRYPIGPTRSFDPIVSEDFQLTHCFFDDASRDCLPTRTAGEAVDVELSGSDQNVYAVWADSRHGRWEIYFKRTDTWVSNNPTPRLTTGCSPFGDAWIDVEFDLVDGCPTGFDRLERYLIYWGTETGGPWQNALSPIQVRHDPSSGPTATARITGLSPGTSHQVLVALEDQARNISPWMFDAEGDEPMPWNTEVNIVTPDPCVAQPPCLFRSDVTSVRPHDPARTNVYSVPRTAEDIGLQGVPYQCPIADGDLEQDPNAYDNGVALVLYQVNRPVDTLRLERAGSTIRFRGAW